MNAGSVARATALTHVDLETPLLFEVTRFYEDFGLRISARSEAGTYLRAAGTAPYVLGLVPGARARLRSVGLAVSDEAALHRLASLPGASAVAPGASPGGGLEVSLRSPGGTTFVASFGRSELPPLPARPAAEVNRPSEKRRIGRAVRLSRTPDPVDGLAHVVLDTPAPARTVAWLTETFGMIVSDAQPLDEAPGSLVATFLRLDLGETPTAHHTLAVALGPFERVGHLAFDVAGLDDLAIGAAWLKERGHRHTWGIGRHLLGSQLFDYWTAPDGIVVEHCADGDVFPASHPAGQLPFTGSNLLQWGPAVPARFGVPPLSVANAVAAFRTLLGRHRASLPRLLAAKRALSH